MCCRFLASSSSMARWQHFTQTRTWFWSSQLAQSEWMYSTKCQTWPLKLFRFEVLSEPCTAMCNIKSQAQSWTKPPQSQLFSCRHVAHLHGSPLVRVGPGHLALYYYRSNVFQPTQTASGLKEKKKCNLCSARVNRDQWSRAAGKQRRTQHLSSLFVLFFSIILNLKIENGRKKTFQWDNVWISKIWHKIFNKNCNFK